MLKTVNAIIDKDGKIKLLERVRLKRAHKALVTILEEKSEIEEVTLLSEKSLEEDWNKPGEDEAWSHLQ